MANFRKRLYSLLVAPRHHDEDTQNREFVLNILLAGTLAIMLITVVLLLGTMVATQSMFLITRTLMVSIVTAFVGGLYLLSRSGRHKLTAYLLVGVYFLLASSLAYSWGTNIPSGILLYGLVIVLSGILLGPTYSLYTTGAVAITLTALQLAAEQGLIHPDWSWNKIPPDMIDVFGYCLIFGVIALVSWLFNRQMTRSLRRAKQAERALTKQKGLLETTVEERTRELQAAQLEKIQQMYRFAELGQLSTALLHDLSNHLTTLMLDIEDLKGQTRSRALARSKRSIRYIDEMVVQVRNQLLGKHRIRAFNIASEIEAVVALLTHRAHAANVIIDWQPPQDKKSLRCRGEPIRFRQLIANLVSNAIDAYEAGPSSDKLRILVTAEATSNRVVITVNDWGSGIPKSKRAKLFEPFYSTKKTGMGMGLFIVKQIAEEHFLGSVALDDSKKYSSFVVSLPGLMHDA